MKTLTLLFCFIGSFAFAQGTAKKDSPVKLDQEQRLDSVMISAANQADIAAIQKAITEINDADYVKKQTSILNDKLMTIVNTLLKAKFDPDKIVENSLRYEPGKLTVRIKK